MDQEHVLKYGKCKLIVVKWQNDFRKTKNRIPSTLDFEDAPSEVRKAYKVYYELKTRSLTQTLTDDIGDTEDFNDDDSETLVLNGSTLDVSSAISDLLNPDNSVLTNMDQNVSNINENAWSDDLLIQPKVKKPTKPKDQQQGPTKLTKKFSFNMEHAVVKPLRNPKKGLSRPSSMNGSLVVDAEKNEELPDLETILLEKSRSAKNPESSNASADLSNLVNHVDKGWLNRNSSVNAIDKPNLTQTQSTLSATSSFGLSNLNIKTFSSTSLLNIPALSAEVKFHLNDASDGEIIIGNSEDESDQPTRPFLHVAKKRRLSADLFTNEDIEREIDDKIATSNSNLESDHQQTVQGPKQRQLPTLKEDGDFDGDDDSDKDPTFVGEPSSPPPVMKRKRSLVKRSKDGITKVAKKATQLLTRGKKAAKIESDTEENVENKEEELNFLIDSDISTVTTTPRVSTKEMKSTEALLDQYLKNDTRISNANTGKVVDAKTTAKKVALQKKIASGTLNENYVRVNLKKKMFVRGKKSFSFSKYKKGVWRSKKAAALAGPEMDMRGCDGGVLICHSCGGVGHFAQQCKKKSDNLLPLDADIGETSEFPSLEQAAQMAEDKRLFVHSSKPDNLPTSSNKIWKENIENLEDSDDDECDMEHYDKENQDNNIENVPSTSHTSPAKFMGHKIPEDILLKSGLLDKTVGGKDQIQPVYSLDNNESLPSTPNEVFQALKLFGHKNFRNGQEQAIMRVLCGVSTLVTLSTGSGKSLCYQLPAYLYRKKSHCITLVVSPLVSLMEDQVHGIPDFINAQCLHTNQTPKQRDKIMEQIKSGKVEILLVSPEAIVAGEKSTGFGSLLRQLPPIAFACIDEAHCVSQWSHNFRPSYLMICRVLREKLGVKTILGLTATATIHTRESIVNHLGIPDGLKGIISDIPLPENLVLTVSKDENRDRALLGLLRSERFAQLQSIIVYCTRREECERISGILRTSLQENAEPVKATTSKKRKRINWGAEAYHAGLPASRRRTIQNAFMSSELRIVVATVAFGMGINKSDIRGIIHYNMPKSFENYVQEVGRAGRDGKPSHCHVFLDSRGNDLSELRRHIYANSIDRHTIRKLLRKVFVPCACGQQSRKSCGKERNCKGHEVSFSVDGTVQSLDIPEENIATLLCYLELHEERYIKVLGNAYTKCKIMSYGGPNYLKQAAKNCPPLAMAIAMNLKKSESTNMELSSIEFDVIEIAAAIGWDSGVVKYQLKQLEWTAVNGASKRSLISTSFSDLGFRIRSPGDLIDDELDTALDTLSKRTTSQESTQLYQLQVIFNSFSSLAFAKYNLCCTDDFPKESSDKLKELIRKYFQATLPENVELSEDGSNTSDNEILTDIRQMISMYPENNFSGRALARLFHGISSPCYPAVVWGRCKYWRAHMNVSFNRLVTLGNSALVKMRTVE